MSIASLFGYAAIAIVVGGGAVIGSLGIKMGTNLPDHAMLLADTRVGSYVTVPCIMRGATDQSYVANVDALAGSEEVWYEPFVEPMTKREARDRGFKPDRACANAEGFVAMEPWLFHFVGATPPRVADDGTVLW